MHYNNLIHRAKNRILSGYTEDHHIIPVCIGGLDEPENIITLTAREHYIAHALLVKIYYNTQHVYKLVYAFNFMCCDSHNGNRKSSKNRTYSLARELFSKFHPMKTDEAKNKMKAAAKLRIENTSKEERYRVPRVEVECACGCGEKFIKIKTKKQIYIAGHHNKFVWQDQEIRDKQSNTISSYIETLTKEELKFRMKNSFGRADPVERGKAISKSKKGKKTNQAEIEIEKYGKMSDLEFSKHVENRAKNVQSRMRNRRQKYYDRINNK